MQVKEQKVTLFLFWESRTGALAQNDSISLDYVSIYTAEFAELAWFTIFIVSSVSINADCRLHTADWV